MPAQPPSHASTVTPPNRDSINSLKQAGHFIREPLANLGGGGNHIVRFVHPPGRPEAAAINPIDEIPLRLETMGMANAPTTSYDEVPYPSAVYAQTHPDRLAVIATLLGLKPAPVESCRVLELGCGDGWNLISMAYGLPESEFVGIDLATQPVARGTALVQKLGLKNVSLQIGRAHV